MLCFLAYPVMFCTMMSEAPGIHPNCKSSVPPVAEYSTTSFYLASVTSGSPTHLSCVMGVGQPKQDHVNFSGS